MSAKSTISPTSSGGDALSVHPRAAITLSDGSVVFLADNYGSPRRLLIWRQSGDRTAAPVPVLAAASSGYSDLGLDFAPTAVARDDVDNLYVIGRASSESSRLQVVVLARGGTAQAPTWAFARTNTFASANGGYAHTKVSAVWVNTASSGGSAGGRLAVFTTNGVYHQVTLTLLDLPDKTGANPATMAMTTLWWQSNSQDSSHQDALDVSQDGHGSASLMVSAPGTGSSRFVIGAVTIPSSGNAVPALNILTNAEAISTNGYRTPFVTRVGADRWIVISGYKAGTSGEERYYGWAVSSTALLSSSASPQGVNLGIGGLSAFLWTAYADPRRNGSAFTLARTSWNSTSKTHIFARLKVTYSAGSGLVWDTGAVQLDTQVDDAPTMDTLRSAKVDAGSTVDWQFTLRNNTLNPQTWTSFGNTDGFNTLPNAPTITAPAAGSTQDRAAAIRVAATHDDPDGNAQAGLKVQYRVAGTLGAWTELTRSDATGYVDVPVNTLAGNIVVRAATSDGEGYGPWSAERTFIASDANLGAVSTLPSRVDPGMILNTVQTQRLHSPAV